MPIDDVVIEKRPSSPERDGAVMSARRRAVPALTSCARPPPGARSNSSPTCTCRPPSRAPFEAWRRYMRDTQADAVLHPRRPVRGLGRRRCARRRRLRSATAPRCCAARRAAPPVVLHARQPRLPASAPRLLDALRRARCCRPDRARVRCGERWLLTHGDALCLADTDYQAFRAQVRTPGWQRDFLAQPLAERRAIGARAARRKRSSASATARRLRRRRRRRGAALAGARPTQRR